MAAPLWNGRMRLGPGFVFCASFAFEKINSSIIREEWIMKITVTVLTAFLAFALSGADFTGVPIVYSAKATQFEKLALKDLQNCLQKATGKKFPLLTEAQFKGKRSIQFGFTDACVKYFAGEKYPSRQTWRIKSTDQTLYIYGGSPSGAVYGIYDFLNRNNIYFLAPDCTAVPSMAKLECSGLDVKQSPSFADRELYHGLYLSADWKNTLKPIPMRDFLRRNFAGILREDQLDKFRISYATKSTCHTFYYYIPPAKYAKSHPEYYSMDHTGKRVCIPASGTQLCLSNPEVRKLLVKQLLDWIAQDRKICREKNLPVPMLYDFSQQDNCSFLCYCKPCQTLIRKYGGDTGLLLDTVNEMAREVAKKYPGVYIQTFAYVNTEKPSDKIKPEKNVVIKYCDVYSRSNMFFPLRTQESRRKLLCDWLDQTPNVYLWDYWNMGWFAGVEKPGMIVDAVIDDLRFFHEKKVPALFLEAEISPYRPQSFIFLQYFLGAQLMKDVSQDAEKLIDVYIRNYYGPSAGEIRSYFDMMRNAIRKSDPDRKKLYSFVTVPFLQKSLVILRKALQKAGSDPAYRKRVMDEMNVVAYALIRRSQLVKIPGLDRDKLIKEYHDNMIFAMDHNWMVTPAGRKRALSALEADVAFFNVNYALPKELAGYPAEKIRRLGYPQFPWEYTDVKIVHDHPASDMANSIAYLPSDQKKHKLPFPMGLYDRPSKKSLASSRLVPAAPDEKYHWYKLGKIKLGKDTIIWGSSSWFMSIYLKDFYVSDDGVDEKVNPNVCEVWISVRFSGPAYNKGSKNPNGVYVDKIVLARCN